MTSSLERPTNLSSSGGIKGTWTPSKGPPQIRVFTLNDGEHQEAVLYRLEKGTFTGFCKNKQLLTFLFFPGWKLQFRLGPTLLGRRIRLYTNHPSANDDEGPTEFDRTQYRAVIWHHESRNKDDDTAMYADVPIIACGSYHYYFVDDERLVFCCLNFFVQVII